MQDLNKTAVASISEIEGNTLKKHLVVYDSSEGTFEVADITRVARSPESNYTRRAFHTLRRLGKLGQNPIKGTFAYERGLFKEPDMVVPWTDCDFDNGAMLIVAKIKDTQDSYLVYRYGSLHIARVAKIIKEAKGSWATKGSCVPNARLITPKGLKPYIRLVKGDMPVFIPHTKELKGEPGGFLAFEIITVSSYGATHEIQTAYFSTDNEAKTAFKRAITEAKADYSGKEYDMKPVEKDGAGNQVFYIAEADHPSIATTIMLKRVLLPSDLTKIKGIVYDT